MSVIKDMDTMTKMANKGVYSGTTSVDMYTAYILALILISNDEVASTKSRSYSQLYSDDLLHSATYQYCVEAIMFLKAYSATSLKNGVLFYASAVLFMHRDKNTIEHWHRVAPNEINSPKVHRYVAKALFLLEDNELLTRMSFPSASMAFCLASFLEVHPDTYETVSDAFEELLEYADEVDALAPFLTAHNNIDNYTIDKTKPDGELVIGDNARRRIIMELAMQCDGVVVSYAAVAMTRGWYKQDPFIELGKQPDIVTDLIEYEALRRGLLFTEQDFEELNEFGFPTSLYGDKVDIDKLFEFEEEAK